MSDFIEKYSIHVHGGAFVAAAAVVAASFFWLSGRTFARLLPVLEYRAPASSVTEVVIAPPPVPRHISTPTPVRALYMTSWVAGTVGWREDIARFVETSEANALVIDIKDYTGTIAFQTGDPFIEEVGSEKVRIRDIQEFIRDLHRRGIYVIGRIAVFQDPVLAKMRPDIAVQRENGALWRDHKGISWIDPASREAWVYAVQIGKAAERVGFDELNYDYVRFPSDGNMQDITYPVWDGKTERSDVIAEFFAYLRKHLADTDIPISVDLFGMVTTNTDDLNIGQILEKAIPHVDYIAPMVYPSHYPEGFQGFKNPAAHPYEVVHYAMSEAVRRMHAASSTPSKLRPWLQDFNLGATYDAEKVRAEKQAVYDAGLDSWMMWDPRNEYTREAYR